MKSLTIAFVAICCSTGASASTVDYKFEDGCCDRVVTQLVCRDTRGHYDEGITVTIESGGLVGITAARVAHTTIAGTKRFPAITVTPVEAPSNYPGLVAYRGAKFRLVINTADVRRELAPAKLKTVIRGKTVSTDMACRIVR